MPTCCGIKKTLGVCGKNVRPTAVNDVPDHLHFCGTHLRIYLHNANVDGHHQPGQCQMMSGRHWCPNRAAEGEHVCGDHIRRREAALLREAQKRTRILRIRTFIHTFLQMNPAPSWREVAVILHDQLPDNQPDIRYDIVRLYYVRLTGRSNSIPLRYWTWLDGGRVGPDPTIELEAPPPPPPQRGTLEQISQDPQSVHTAPVSRQTNTATETLLAIPVPVDQQTEKTLMRAWLCQSNINVGWHEMLRVAADINKWFTTVTCRVTNDNLYRKLLRGLVARINKTDDEMKAELFKRTWEECREATGMCCEGHISRICNVLVGFDEAFQPQVSLGELMQQKMAAIAGMDVSEEEKRQQATVWFDQMAVPHSDRIAWLDAF